MVLPLLLVFAHFGQQAAPPNIFRPRAAHLLKVKGNLGDTYVYETVTRMSDSASGDSFTMRAKVTEVLGRKFGHQIDWDTTVWVHDVAGTGKFEPMAAQIRQGDGKVTTTVRNEQGRLLKTISNNQVIDSTGSGDVSFPDNVVEIGGTWQEPIGVAGKTVTIEYTLTKVVVLHGRKVACIEGYYLPGQGVKAIDKTQFWVDLDSGRTVSSRIHVKVETDGSEVTLLSTSSRVSMTPGPPVPGSQS